MNNEVIREYCLAKPGVTEGFPFNETALVFKVMNKMFALLDLSEESRGISLKCDPELAIAYHFNKIIITLFYTVKVYLLHNHGDTKSERAPDSVYDELPG